VLPGFALLAESVAEACSVYVGDASQLVAVDLVVIQSVMLVPVSEPEVVGSAGTVNVTAGEAAVLPAAVVVNDAKEIPKLGRPLGADTNTL